MSSATAISPPATRKPKLMDRLALWLLMSSMRKRMRKVDFVEKDTRPAPAKAETKAEDQTQDLLTELSRGQTKAEAS